MRCRKPFFVGGVVEVRLPSAGLRGVRRGHAMSAVGHVEAIDEGAGTVTVRFDSLRVGGRDVLTVPREDVVDVRAPGQPLARR